jgi:methylated-DNA-[protein]-cysteine S-methyltransferase
MEQYCWIETPLGAIGLAWSAKGIVRLQLPDADRAKTRARLLGRREAEEADPPAWLEATIVRLEAYFADGRVELSDAPLDLAGVPEFHRRLYAEMLRLGWGEVVTYGELAARVGAPGAAQAVGRAMGANPIPVIIPCHRVLAAGRRTGGFSAPGGTRTKLRMLEMEGVVPGTHRDQLAFGF